MHQFPAMGTTDRATVPFGHFIDFFDFRNRNPQFVGQTLARRYIHERLVFANVSINTSDYDMWSIENSIESEILVRHVYDEPSHEDNLFQIETEKNVKPMAIKFCFRRLLELFRNEEGLDKDQLVTKFSNGLQDIMKIDGISFKTTDYLISKSDIVLKVKKNLISTSNNDSPVAYTGYDKNDESGYNPSHQNTASANNVERSVASKKANESNGDRQSSADHQNKVLSAPEQKNNLAFESSNNFESTIARSIIRKRKQSFSPVSAKLMKTAQAEVDNDNGISHVAAPITDGPRETIETVEEVDVEFVDEQEGEQEEEVGEDAENIDENREDAEEQDDEDQEGAEEHDELETDKEESESENDDVPQDNKNGVTKPAVKRRRRTKTAQERSRKQQAKIKKELKKVHKIRNNTRAHLCYFLKKCLISASAEIHGYDPEKVKKALDYVEQYYEESQGRKMEESAPTGREQVSPTATLEAPDHSKFFENILTEVSSIPSKKITELWQTLPNAGSYAHIPNIFHGKLLMDPMSTSGDISANVAQLLPTKKNLVYNNIKHQNKVPYPDKGEHRVDTSTYPAVRVSTRSEMETPNFKKLVTTPPILVIENLAAATGIDTSVFEMEAIRDASPQLLVDVLFQNPQPVDTNSNEDGKKRWKTFGVKCRMTVTQLVERMVKLQEESRQMLSKMVESENLMNTVEEIFDKLVKEQELPPELHDAANATTPLIPKQYAEMFWIPFGTNVDIVDSTDGNEWKTQLDELKKFPSFLQHSEPMNLLNIAGIEILGANTPQAYIKAPGARTVAHMENHLMGSLNWNVGNADVIWFATAYQHWRKIEKLASKSGCKYLSQSYWPLLEDMLAAQIPVSKIVQRPGDIVYVGTGTFHFVQSEGFTVNVSYNLGFPTYTQLATSIISHSHNIVSRNPSVVPFEETIWKIAENKYFTDDAKVFKLIRSFLLRSLANIGMYHSQIVANKHNLVQWKGDHKDMVVCSQCRTELFNTIREFKGTNDALHFCSKCTPGYSHQNEQVVEMADRPREEIFYFRHSIEQLQKWFDEYQRT